MDPADARCCTAKLMRPPPGLARRRVSAACLLQYATPRPLAACCPGQPARVRRRPPASSPRQPPTPPVHPARQPPPRPRARAGWTDGSRRTPYPCQVSVEVYLACPPVPADQLRGVIAENYQGNTDKFQVGVCVQLVGGQLG